jgi:hypothetical protein
MFQSIEELVDENDRRRALEADRCSIVEPILHDTE